jgi:hypothetical protein
VPRLLKSLPSSDSSRPSISLSSIARFYVDEDAHSGKIMNLVGDSSCPILMWFKKM